MKAARLIGVLSGIAVAPTTTGRPGSPVHDAFFPWGGFIPVSRRRCNKLRNEDAPVPRVETRTYDTATGY